MVVVVVVVVRVVVLIVARTGVASKCNYICFLIR